MSLGNSRFNKSWLKALLGRPWLLPDKILVHLFAKLTQHITLSPAAFGWAQAILYWEIDIWERYSSVVQEIAKMNKPFISILDVGGNVGDIRGFLNPNDYRLCVLDINIEALKKNPKMEMIAGDGCHLPFKDNSFDIVTSVDSLEHVPNSKKQAYCEELKRVAKSYVIIHCPADSSDEKFLGTTCDIMFLQWYRKRFKRDEPNTMEHLNSGLPKVEELAKLFPGTKIVGKQNPGVWLRCMKWEYTPYVRFITGVFYKLFLMKMDNLPPYHACLLVWRKE